LTIQATSSNLGTTRETSAPLNVSADPLIFDLTPANDTHTGANEVLFCWRTSVTSTSDVFIKAEGEAEYTLVSNESGTSHAVPVSDLFRDTWYNFYVRSNSTHGSATSEVRSMFIDNGITFSRRNYEFTIERDYNQERTITIVNTDDEPHEVLLNVSGVPEDLALNFVGEGSMDQVIPLHPGESKDIAIAFHAQDAQVEDYTILFNLTNLGAEEITDFANLKLHVHFPVINFTIEEISSDPHTLAKTIKVSNTGDPLTDLIVSASDELSSIVMFQPSIDHAYLGTGGSIELEVIPVLSEDFTGASGTIIASAAGEEQSLAVDFSCSDGKQIFTGRLPIMTIDFAEGFDTDDIPNTNPSGEYIDSYLFKSGEQSSVTFIAQIMVEVRQNGKPGYQSNVSLELSGHGLSETFYAITDLWGKAVFIVYGPTGEFSYTASIVGYNITTDTRTFTINETPMKAITDDIVWLSASDSDSTFDLTNESIDEITMDAPPFVFRANRSSMTDDTMAILYLNDESEYYSAEVIGEVEGDTITFDLAAIEMGSYSARIVTQSETELAISSSKKFILLDETEASEPVKYTYQVPFPINESSYEVLNIERQIDHVDSPNKIIKLLCVTPNDNNTNYVFTYMIIADQTMDDTVVVKVTDEHGSTLYESTQPIHLEEYEADFLDVPVPIYDASGDRIGEFNITVKTLNYFEWVGKVYHWATDTGGILDFGKDGTWHYFLKDGIFTPRNRAGVIGKCFVGFVSGGITSTIITVADTVSDFMQDKTVEGGSKVLGGVSGQLVDPLINMQKAQYLINEKMVHESAKSFYRQGLTKIAAKARLNYMNVQIKHLKKLRNLGRIAKAAGWIGTAISNYQDWQSVTAKQDPNKAGLTETRNSHVRNCINHAPLENRFQITSDLDYFCSPVQNVEGVFVTAYFPRSVPASYQPFDTIVKLNGHEIGRIANAVPQGYYTFEADPSFLNYAEAGVAENTITLDVEGMNRGYYVPLEGYNIDIVFKKLTRAVCVASQTEADQIVANLSTAMTHGADFEISSQDISFSNPHPSEGENTTIEATIHNLGSLGMSGVHVQFLDDGEEIDGEGILYLPAFSSQTVSSTWDATGGTHIIQVRVNPDKEIEESDYTNNEASKTISVTAPDSTSPVISNPQPPDGYHSSENHD
jgi:hypothetical protein